MKNKEKWISFYQSNPDKFIEDYLDVKLTWYQKAMLKMPNSNPVVAPHNLGRRWVNETMREVYKVLYGDKE